MSLPYVCPPSEHALHEHSQRVARCHGTACFQELVRVVGTHSYNQMEVLVDDYEPRRDADGRKIWSGKYRKWVKEGALPNDETIERAYERTDGRSELKRWRDLPLWPLLSEPCALSPSQLHDVLTNLSPRVRKILFLAPSPNAFGRFPRHELSRQEMQQLRDMRTLDAFIACLVLAREGELMNQDQKHVYAVTCAFAMFAPVVNQHPQLGVQWEALYDCMELAYSSRWYLEGIRPGFAKIVIKDHFEALKIDPNATCGVHGGKYLPLTDAELAEGISDMQLGIAGWERGLGVRPQT